MTSDRARRPSVASAATIDPATTARTALAATHGARLSLPGRVSQDVGCLDDDGEPLIVLCGDGPTLRGPACLSVAAGPRLRVMLGGRLQTLGPTAGDLGELLGDHAACFAPALHAGQVQVVRLAVDEIRVEEGCRSWFVSCADYAAAEPDRWEAFAATVAQHLDTDHRDVLAKLAQLHLPGQRVVAAGLFELKPEELTLDVVTPDGASRVTLPLYARVDDPHELCGRLLDVAAPRLVRDRPGEDRSGTG